MSYYYKSILILVFVGYFFAGIWCLVLGDEYRTTGNLRAGARISLLAPVNFVAWPLWIWRAGVMLGTVLEEQWRLAFGRPQIYVTKDSVQISAEEEVERFLITPNEEVR